MTRALAPPCLLLLAFAACSGPEQAPQATTEAPEGAESQAPADPGLAPLAPITSRGPVDSGASGGSGASATLDFDLPAGWVSQNPESGMRIAQAEIPGAGGPAQLVVTYFGPGGGGPLEANIQRWIGQFSPDGRSEPQRATFTTDSGLPVTTFELSGTLLPSTTGMGPTTDQPGARLLAAVVEGPGGPWFFKATGPDATLAGQRDAFRSLVRSARLRS